MHKLFQFKKIDSKNLILFSSSFFANLSFFSMLAILTLYFTQTCHFSLRFSGIFMFLVLLFSRVGRIILLPLLKSYSAKKSIIISAALMSCGYFVIYSSKNTFLMLFAFLIMGMGYGCNSVYVRSLIGMNKSTNKLAYVHLNMVTNFSAAIGSLLAVYIFTHFSGENVFLYAAISMLISTLFIYGFLSDEKDHATNSSMLDAIRFILTTPGVLRIFLFTILVWITCAQIFSVLPLLINNQLGATKWLGNLYAINTIMIVLFSVPISKYLIKFHISMLQFLTIGFLLMSCGFCLLYLMPTITISCVTMVLWTLGEILMLPVLNSSLSELTKGAERLNVFAFNGIAIGLGEGIGMYLGTTLIALQPASRLNEAYLYLALITLCFLLIVFTLKPAK